MAKRKMSAEESKLQSVVNIAANNIKKNASAAKLTKSEIEAMRRRIFSLPELTEEEIAILDAPTVYGKRQSDDD